MIFVFLDLKGQRVKYKVCGHLEVGLWKAPFHTLFPNSKEVRCLYEPCHRLCLERANEGGDLDIFPFAAAVDNMAEQYDNLR